MSTQRIPLDQFTEYFQDTTELSSVALGGQVISVSDEFFAEAYHLLLTEPAPSLKGQFGPNGALFSGWESRRHNPTYDWCVIKLGAPGNIVGFDIDTSHFNGNEAMQASVEGISLSPSEQPSHDHPGWREILPKMDLGPNSRHLFTIPSSLSSYSHVKLNMFPDGGIARFRVYGRVVPVSPSDPMEVFDLAHVFAGGHVIKTSDQHFGVGSNLILPGRGKDMGDGWETKRSRQKGHKDWVVIKLGTPGLLEYTEIDTAHFKGNFPESCEIHGALIPESEREVDWETTDNSTWTEILPRTKLGPDRQQYFQLENVAGRRYSHVRVTIYPDGGLKRVRILGRVSEAEVNTTVTPGTSGALESSSTTELKDTFPPRTIHALPLTPEAFAPFGQVIQAYSDGSAPKGVIVTPANGGSALKFHKLVPILSSYPPDANATRGISVYRCQPLKERTNTGNILLETLERHPFTNQAFVPMGPSAVQMSAANAKYLVIVAHGAEDGGPDLTSLRAFVASTNQGITYNVGVWHQPMTVLNTEIDFACVETQIGGGDSRDCEIIQVGTKVEVVI